MDYIVALIVPSIIVAVAAQTGNISVYSSMYLATVTIQYMQNDGLKAINTYNGIQRGMHVVVVDGDTGNLTSSNAFDTFDSHSEADELFSFINSVPNGQILCFAIVDEALNNLYDRSIFRSLGSQYIDVIGYRSFWNFVVVKGGEVIGENYTLNIDPDNTWPEPLTLTVSIPIPVTIPYNLVVVNVTSTSSTLQWNVPMYHPTVFLMYLVNYYQADDVTSSMEASTLGNITTLLISGLNSGQLYTFKVRTITQRGLSGYSTPVNAATLEDVPGPVADLKVAASTFTTVILQWRPPLHPNGIITSYKVSIINQSLGQQIVTSVNVHVLSLTLFNLPLLSKHNISVFACTSKGAGVQSYIVGSTAIVPNVTGICAISINKTAVHVSWDPVQLPSDGVLVGYTVFYHDVQESDNMNMPLPPTYTWGDMTGLDPDHSYKFGVSTRASVNGILVYGAMQLLAVNQQPDDKASSTLIPLSSALAIAFLLILIATLAVIILTVLLFRRRSTIPNISSDRRNNVKDFDMDTNAAYEATSGHYYI